MKEKHIPYSYKKAVFWILVTFIIAVVTPRLVALFRYSEFRWLWQIGASASFLLIFFVNIAVIINAVFTYVEFKLTGKYNWYWFVLGILPFLFYFTFFIVVLLDSNAN